MQISLILDTLDGDDDYNVAKEDSNDGLTLIASGGEDLDVMTLLDVYDKLKSAHVRLTGLDEEGFGLQNPCSITVDASLPDILRNLFDPVSTSEDTSATTFETCPSATEQFLEYQLAVVDVIDLNGNSVANPNDYIEVT